MSRMRIDIATVGAGTIDRSRSDGVSGQLVTVTSTDTATTHLIRLVNTTDASPPTLSQVGSTPVWTFTPTNGANTYVLECITDQGLATEASTRRVYAIKTTNLSLRLPGPNEKASPEASLQNSGAAYIAASEHNESGNYLGWAPDMTAWLRAVDTLQGSFDALDGQNDGAGEDVFKSRSGNTMLFRTLVASTGVTITASTDTLSFASTTTDTQNTLDQAYDEGGAGAGRTITVDSGAVQMLASTATTEALRLNGYMGFQAAEVCLGGGSHTIGTNATMVGQATNANGPNGVAIGLNANAARDRSTALGSAASSAHTASICVGASATSTASHQLLLGSSSYYVTEAILGGGSSNINERALTIRGSNASGGNRQGWDVTLQAGRGTGTAAGGLIGLSSSFAASTSGSTLNAAHTFVTIDPGDAHSIPIKLQSHTTTVPLRLRQFTGTTVSTTATILSVDTSSITTASHGIARCRITGRSDSAATTWNSYELAAKITIDASGNVTVHTAAGSQEIWADEDQASMSVFFAAGTQTLDLDMDTGVDAETWKWHGQLELLFGT